jgi:DNA-binding NarL/FixJ family response regulator
LAGLLGGKFTVVAQAEDGYAALRNIKKLRPQLAILDLSNAKKSMAGGSGAQ